MAAAFTWQTKQPSSTESLLRAPTLELGAPPPEQQSSPPQASTRPAQPTEENSEFPPSQSLKPAGEKEQTAHPGHETAPSPATADTQQVPAAEGTRVPLRQLTAHKDNAAKADEQTNTKKRKQTGQAVEHRQQPRQDESTPLENTYKRPRRHEAATAPAPPDQRQEVTKTDTQGKDMRQAKQQAKRAQEPKSSDDRPAKVAKTACENGAAKRKQQSTPADSNCNLGESKSSRGDLEEVALEAATRATQDAIDGMEAKAAADPTQDDHHQPGHTRDKNCNVHGKALPAEWCSIPYVTPGDQNRIAPKAKAKSKAKAKAKTKASDKQAAPKRKSRAKATGKALKVPPGQEHEEDAPTPTESKPATSKANARKSRARKQKGEEDKENHPPPDNSSQPPEVETGASPTEPPPKKVYEKTAEQKAKNSRKSVAYARKMAEMLRKGMSKDEAKIHAKEAGNNVTTSLKFEINKYVRAACFKSRACVHACTCMWCCVPKAYKSTS